MNPLKQAIAVSICTSRQRMAPVRTQEYSKNSRQGAKSLCGEDPRCNTRDSIVIWSQTGGSPEDAALTWAKQ
ncbi:MAG: hypothetical protein EOP48_29695 [Sphingobacteriales bacterium]|nr:MAG: hypothetical protein EOP48_29695 [Sphingobacteriales bacterium]